MPRGVAHHGTEPRRERFTVSAFTPAAYALAASIGTPALIVSLWAGSLYHRVLNLPPDKHEHGLKVLAQLTALLHALPRHRNPKT
jgi:hypothetical protein